MRYIDSINQSLHKLLASNPTIYLIGEDLLDPYGGAFKVSKGLSTAYPNQVISTPISEAGIVGFAIGLALCQCNPIVEIMFGDFITLCADQIINGATKFNWMYAGQIDVPMVIRTPMGGRRGYGPTHSQTLESLFLNVPGISIVAPSELHDPGLLLEATVTSTKQPVLFIENKALYPQIIQKQFSEFVCEEIAIADPRYPTKKLRVNTDQTTDLILIAYGGMAGFAVAAAKSLFFSYEIVVEVLVPSLIKPFPMEDIEHAVCRVGHVLVVDESPAVAGWASCLIAHLVKKNLPKLKAVDFIGAKEHPIPASITQEHDALLQTDNIVDAISKMIKH